MQNAELGLCVVPAASRLSSSPSIVRSAIYDRLFWGSYRFFAPPYTQIANKFAYMKNFLYLCKQFVYNTKSSR